MKRIVTCILVCLGFYTLSQGQGRGIYKTKFEKLVDFTGHNRFHGFHFAPGFTWTQPPFGEKEKEIYRSGDTVTQANMQGKGKLGLYVEAGMYHLLRYGRFFRYLDWSIAYKGLKATQTYSTVRSIESSSTQLGTATGDNQFKYGFLLANVNLNNIWQIGNYSFIQNAIGLNFDYALIKNETANGGFSPSTFDKIVCGLHYKLGFGFKVNQKLFVIPSVETPILNVAPFESGKSTLGVFDLRYRPIIFTVRIAWLRKPKANECPPVYGPDGDKQRQEQYQMGR